MLSPYPYHPLHGRTWSWGDTRRQAASSGNYSLSRKTNVTGLCHQQTKDEKNRVWEFPGGSVSQQSGVVTAGGSGHCCGMDSISGPKTSACHRGSQKIKQWRSPDPEGYRATTLWVAGQQKWRKNRRLSYAHCLSGQMWPPSRCFRWLGVGSLNSLKQMLKC